MKFVKLVKAEEQEVYKLEEIFPDIDKLQNTLATLRQSLEAANEYPTDKNTINMIKQKFHEIDSVIDDIDRILMGEF